MPREAPRVQDFGYVECVEVCLQITKDFPLRAVCVYSEKIFLANRERALIAPEGEHRELHQLLRQSPENYKPPRPYTFIIIEKKPHYLRYFLPAIAHETYNGTPAVMRDAQLWAARCENLETYYESENLVVYVWRYA